MKILIFGANGFVGPYLINEFLNKDYEVSASDLQEELFTEGFREKLFDLGYFFFIHRYLPVFRNARNISSSR